MSFPDLRREGIASVCSAHPLVLRAALRGAAKTGRPTLIEATCNQVNHLGGYTGMRPADFAELVFRIAAEEGCDRGLIHLGGDHLGPNPWRVQPAEAAMEEACRMVEAYVAAGFSKIHLDASMGCAGEPEALDDATTATRAARLAGVAEATAKAHGLPAPIYVIGTEVPPPGGADHVLSTITPTAPEAARQTIAIHRDTFARVGLQEAFSRAIGLVVQPGVEFGNHNVIFYDADAARDLIAVLKTEPQFVFEAHSTDYQGLAPLRQLVLDGFAILKVGPELTFVLREALYALDLIASDLIPGHDRALMRAMEALMAEEPGHWKRHYGDAPWLRHYSLSDRIRYYWAHPRAQAAVAGLFDALRGQKVPLPLFWQHLPNAAEFADRPLDPEAVVLWRIEHSLSTYRAATAPI